MFLDPEECLVGALDGECLDACGERLIRLGRPHLRSRVARQDVVDTALVPVHRPKDDDRPARALDVAVKSLPEALSFIRWNEWVDQYDSVSALVVETADVALPAGGAALVRRPIRMQRRPAPEPRRNLLYLHET